MALKKETFGDRIIAFNRRLDYTSSLPGGIRIMNPFRESEEVPVNSERFYRKYYEDNRPRRLILGINPGRFGAGATGIPFTDTKRLEEACGIPTASVKTHEMSSVFIYEMIGSYGGPEAFYSRWFISAMCPLGFIRQNDRGTWVNFNYYDSEELFLAVRPFMIRSLEEQAGFGIDRDTCVILGMRVRSRDGGTITMKQSLVRNFGRMVDGLPAFNILGMVAIARSPLRQRIGDRLAGTVVIRTPIKNPTP